MNRFTVLSIIVSLTWIFTGAESRAADNDYLRYIRTDSAYVYRWDAAGSAWVLYQVQEYGYTEGTMTSLLTRDYLTGRDLARTDYTYNDAGRMESATNYNYNNGWQLSTRSLTEYDSYDRVSSVRVQKWSAGAWVEDRLQQNYQYDMEDRLIGYESLYWRSNAWTAPTVSVLNYNDRGDLESRVATRPDGNIDYRIIYEYDSRGYQTQFYTQYPAGSGWSNWNLRTVQYDRCGRKVSQTQYSGEGPNWTLSTKNVFFVSFNYDFYPRLKFPVCHNGKTLWVPVSDVTEHLRHGDCLGKCVDEKDKEVNITRNPPLKIYPNPARESITVEFSPDCVCSDSRLELADFSGSLIKSYQVGDNTSITIERGNLKSGHYFVRLIGNEVYTLSVIFK